MNQAELFRILKPACVRLSDEALRVRSGKSSAAGAVPCVERLLQVLKGLASSRQHLDERLANYVFFPLSHLFKDRDRFPVRSLEIALHCLEILLQTGWRVINDPNLALQLLMMLTFLADNETPASSSAKSSEELVTAAMACVSELFISLGPSTDCKQALFNTPNLPAVGHAVSVMLEDMKHGSSGDLQISAVNALERFCTCAADREVMQSFAPGIFSALSFVLTPSTKSRRHRRLIGIALSVLSQAIKLLFSDGGHDLDETSEDQKNEAHHPDASWLKGAAAQTKTVLANVVRLRQHERHEVRSALLSLCWTVLEHCASTLSDSVPMVLETAISLISKEVGDEDSSRLRHLLSKTGRIAEYAKSSGYESLVSLPRIIMSNDVDAISKAIGEMSTWLRVLIDSEVDMTLIEETFQQNLHGALLSVIGRSSKKEIALTDQSPLEILGRPSNFSPEAHGIHGEILSEETGQPQLDLLNSLIVTISRSKGALRIANRALENAYGSVEDTRLADLWICLQILRSNARSRQFLDVFVTTGVEDDEEDDTRNALYTLALSLLAKHEVANTFDWRLQAIALDVLGFQADQTKKRFRVELNDALYPVIQLFGSPISPLRNQAMKCLNEFASACEYPDARDMLVANVDYLVNAVGIQLNSMDISPQSSRVLMMMIKLCGPPLLPFLGDLFESIFDALECYHGYTILVEQLFSILDCAVEEGVKSLPLVSSSGLSNEKNSNRPETIKALIESTKKTGLSKDDEPFASISAVDQGLPKITPQRPWKELNGRRDSSSSSPELEPGTKDTGDSLGENSAQQDFPQDQKPRKTHLMLQRIALLTQHHLPSSSPALRMSLISLLARAVPFLSLDNDTFLPLVNSLWPVLLPRLLDKEAYVVANVLKVMGFICEGAGDFMCTRVESVWPTIQRIHDACEQPLVFLPSRQFSDKQFLNLQGESIESSDIPYSQMSVSKQAEADTRVKTIRHSFHESSNDVHYASTKSQLIRDALTSFLIQMISHVRITEMMYLEALCKMLYPQLAHEKHPRVREALKNINPDAVDLVLSKKVSVGRPERDSAAVENNIRSNIRMPIDVQDGPKFVAALK